MNSIEILKEEHVNIKRAIKLIRTICYSLVKGEKVPYDDFHKLIDFVRNYGDKYHHAKEEDMLFIHMKEELKSAIGEGPVEGMLIEHNLGRGFMVDLELALESHREGNDESLLDIIAAAMGYANLLTKHIHKEDNMIYVYADKNLKKETIEDMDLKFEELENSAENIAEREKYLDILESLEEKYDVGREVDREK